MKVRWSVVQLADVTADIKTVEIGRVLRWLKAEVTQKIEM